MTSIRARLASGLAVSLALVLVAIGMGSSLAIRHAVEGYLTTRLDHDAQRLTMALRTFPDGRIRVMPHRIDSVFGREHDHRDDANGRLPVVLRVPDLPRAAKTEAR